MTQVLVIAEAGVNHNGDLDLALKLVDAAAAAGADAVKFQTFHAEKMISRKAAKAPYQAALTGKGENQLDMVRRLELSRDAHRALLAHCRKRGIQFLSTPFDSESAEFLVKELDVPRVKIASGDITDGPLLCSVARLGRPVILSTGMSTLPEIEQALGVLAFGFVFEHDEPTSVAFAAAYASGAGRKALAEKVTLLHCTSEYPAPFAEVNLRAMDTLAEQFGLDVGLSDHTTGISVAVAAVARGARVVEKHFTLDRTLPGPDHRASLEPGELASLVESVRQVEQALGNPAKRPSPAELRNVVPARRSLVAAREIRKGEKFTSENLGIKRPAGGASPMRYWEFLGRVALRDYGADEAIDP